MAHLPGCDSAKPCPRCDCGCSRTISTCAATEAAIAAGALSLIAVRPIGQTSLSDASAAMPILLHRGGEARALGRAADQADIGKALGVQRRDDEIEIERMAVRHDGDEGAVGRAAEQSTGSPCADRR